MRSKSGSGSESVVVRGALVRNYVGRAQGGQVAAGGHLAEDGPQLVKVAPGADFLSQFRPDSFQAYSKIIELWTKLKPKKLVHILSDKF
jgi:hypothetical protein